MVKSKNLGITWLLIIASGCCTSAALAQSKRVAPTASQHTSVLQPLAKTQRTVDVFDIGETPQPRIVEVEPVDYETPGRIVTRIANVEGGEIPNSEEWIVGGGGVPTGTYLDNGQWVNDGDVLTDGPLPEGAPNQYQLGKQYQRNDLQNLDGSYESHGPDEYGETFEAMDLPPQYLQQRGVGVSPFWGRANALLWSLEGMNVPPLVSTSVPGTNRLDAGVLGMMGTTVILGNDKLGDSERGGARIEVGGWLPSRSLGWHVAYFGLDNAAETFQFDSTNNAILARPFFSVEPGAVGPNAELIAFPNQLDGNISVSASTSFDGAEVMLHRMLAGDRHRQVQFMAGYQYNSLEDDLRITDFRRITGGSSGLAIGTTLAENDRFQSSNRFNGAALGVLATMRRQRLSMEAGMQMAMGNNHVQYFVDGSTTSSVPVTALAREIVTTPGGLLTQGSNLGSYQQDSFTMIPQLHVDLGYNLNPQLRLLLGYRFLYWSQVGRAGEQIDSRLNLSQLDPGGLTGEARPQLQFRLTDFWAQGLNLGLDYRF